MPQTRAAIKELGRLTAEGTRRQRQLAQQERVAMNRSQTIAVRRGISLPLDQNAYGRTVRIADGTVMYGSITNWRRQGIESIITAKMIAANAGTPAGVRISGEGPGCARGHLLARSLGGDGNDVRNLVPLAHEFTNLQQYQQIERMVLHHVLRHKTPMQQQCLGNVTLAVARNIVRDPKYASLHTSGHYHQVRYTITPRYEGLERVYPAHLEFVAECLTCGEWVQRALVLKNVVQ